MAPSSYWWLLAQLAMSTYMPACMYLYYRRRDRFPICGWDVASMLATGAALVLAVWFGVITALAERVAVPWLFGPMLLFASVAVDGFVLQSAALYAKAHLTRGQVGLAREQSRHVEYDRLPLQRRLDKIWLLRQLLTHRAALVFVAGNISITVGAGTVIMWRKPQLWHMPGQLCHQGSCNELIDFTVGKLALSLLLALLIVYRIRLSADPYGVRRGLLATMSTYLVALGLYAGFMRCGGSMALWARTDWIPLLTLFLLGAHLVFALGIVQFVWASFVPVYAKFKTSGTCGFLLDRFLITPRHFNAFLEHLESEFSVENLLFWRAALEYHITCARLRSACAASDDCDAPSLLFDGIISHWDCHLGDRVSQEAIRIYQTYITDGAPCQINISSEIAAALNLKFIAAEQGDDTVLLDENLFEEARLEIVQLMEYDSLSRLKFATKGGRLWAQFLDQQTASSAASQRSQQSRDSTTIQIRI